MKNASYHQFKDLHEQKNVLLIGNVWDSMSAQIAQKSGFKALGTSSHAIAAMLGYADGEQMSFEELFFVLQRIVKSVNIPVSVDFEAGYSDDPSIVSNYVGQLISIGIVGINLEDGKVINGKRTLQNSSLLAEKIKAIKKDHELFINARIDTYTTKHENALEESIKRASIYEKAGADGIFVPLMEDEKAIKEFILACQLPLNLFASKTLPSVELLSKLGVKRLSHGAKKYDQIMQQLNEDYKAFIETKKYELLLG